MLYYLVLRGGCGHAAAPALLPHVVPVLLVPAGRLERDRRLQCVHRRPVGQNRTSEPHHLRNACRRPRPAARHPAHPRQVGLRRGLLRHRIRGRRHPRLDPCADARLLTPDGPWRRHGVLGARPHHGRAGAPAWWRRTRWTTSSRFRTSSSFRVWCVSAWWSSRSSSCASSRRSCATS